MSEIWPLDVKNKLSGAGADAIRPFKCLLLMPFEARFNQVAEIINKIVLEKIKNFGDILSETELPKIERLDWITSSGVIQQEIWQKIAEADLVFCDITGYNPNVMFESGVCAAWKEMKQVVFIKDRFFKQQSAFDIAPIRYTEYELTSDGMKGFQDKIARLTEDVLIAFPDGQGSSPVITLPLDINFQNNRDDLRIYTPPYAHRRVTKERLEFGSSTHFSHSWASVGKEKFYCFQLEFIARFSNPNPISAYIGVGLRSQHYYANFAHFIYLTRDGRIWITEPNEEPPNFYEGKDLRPAKPIDLDADHYFRIVFSQSNLNLQVDDFSESFEVAKMKKVFGSGLIRFQPYRSWMAIKEVKVAQG